MPKLCFLFVLRSVNSFVMSMVESLSVLSLCMFKTVRLLNRSWFILERSHGFSLRAVEKDLSPAALVAGFKRISLHSLQNRRNCLRILRLPHTSRFFVYRQKIFTCRLVCGEFRQVCDKIGACRAKSDSARSQNVVSGRVGPCRLVCGGPRQFVGARAYLNQ